MRQEDRLGRILERLGRRRLGRRRATRRRARRVHRVGAARPPVPRGAAAPLPHARRSGREQHRLRAAAAVPQRPARRREAAHRRRGGGARRRVGDHARADRGDDHDRARPAGGRPARAHHRHQRAQHRLGARRPPGAQAHRHGRRRAQRVVRARRAVRGGDPRGHQPGPRRGRGRRHHRPRRPDDVPGHRGAHQQRDDPACRPRDRRRRRVQGRPAGAGADLRGVGRRRAHHRRLRPPRTSSRGSGRPASPSRPSDAA